jgi:hypothetical protein
MIEYFWKNTSKIPVDNGSSLNIPITIKIIALTNMTLIETSVLAVYIHNCFIIFIIRPLLCISCDVSKICLPPMYKVIESSPDDQIPPKLFSLVNSTHIYISSNKFVMNGAIFMDLRFNTFPLS